MFKNILVPIDGSDSSVEAAKIGASLAAMNSGKLTLLNVVRLVQYGLEGAPTPEPAAAKAAVKSSHAMLGFISQEIGSSQANIIVATGHPAQTICEQAKEGNFDLVVMGNRGLGGLRGSLIGSVSQKVSEMIHCPVLLCRLPKGVIEEHKIIKALPHDSVIYD